MSRVPVYKAVDINPSRERFSTWAGFLQPLPGMDMRRTVLCERFASDLSVFSSDEIRQEDELSGPDTAERSRQR